MTERRRRSRAAAVAALVILATCSNTSNDDRNAAPTSTSTPTTGREPPSTTAAASTPSTTVPVAGFEASVARIDDAVAARMTASWRPECPVPLGALRLITITHWSLDGDVREGELVVHEEHAGAVVNVFEALFEQRFPIAQVRLVDEFGADDDRSMAANNTSAFNCRRATGSEQWSEHAYGRAVDINPVQNPFVDRTGAVRPPSGAAHSGRDPGTRGLITSDGPVVAAFRSIGWQWGGEWSSGKDYQHFSATGR